MTDREYARRKAARLQASRAAWDAWLRRRYAGYVRELPELDATTVARAANEVRFEIGLDKTPTIEQVRARVDGTATAPRRRRRRSAA